MKSDLLRITGLWTNTDKNNNKYMSGRVNKGLKLLILKNSYKKGESDPDYYAYLSPVETEEKEQEKDKDTGGDIPF